MAGTVINSDIRIGDFCIVNTTASVDHDNNFGDYVQISPAATTSWSVQIRTALRLASRDTEGGKNSCKVRVC